MLTRRDYENAIYSQSACNSCGLVISLAEVMPRMECSSTDERNSHPIVIMYLTQLAFLAGGSFDTDKYLAASNECDRVVSQYGLTTDPIPQSV